MECLTLKKSNCKNCYKCIRHCPVKSIRFSGNQAYIIGNECIMCGQCFVVCPQNAKQIVSEVDKVRVMLQSGAPVVASLAPSFVANYAGSDIAELRRALGQLGFYDAEETALGATVVKREYDRLADALASVRATGYGVVGPGPEELKLEKPEVLKKNGSYGVKLRAMAPSIHMIRVDVDTEISPMVGGEEQSKELIEYVGGQEPEKLWQSNIFGKSVYDLIQEGLNAKLLRLPEDVRTKFRGTLGRIVNEGATGLVCLIL